MAGQTGLFNLQDRYAELSKSGDPLERLSSVMDFEVFRPTLDAALGRKDRSKGGRPPLDAVMMFKILVLQALYGLSDEQAEYQVRDRLSFMRFLGLGLGDRVPDRTTIWLFREALVTAGAMEGLFARFDADLKERGYFALGGQIIDASIVEAPRQRLTREEKRQIRDGEDPPWPPAKARQKDTQARWTVKRGRVKAKPGPTLDGSEARMVEGLLIPAFGYKSHITIDRRFRLIQRFIVTDAARHDGAQLPGLLNPDAFDSRVWADSAYRSKANEAAITAAGRRSMVHFRKPKGRPMPEPHQRANRARSAVRSAVEHVFADQKARMGLFIRTIGLGRATVKIGLANLAYNFRRLIWLEGRTAPV
ncbi:transposase (plasmid) [Azospirillum argentinense]|uniref:Transposase n=1 Tax=Azospirillum argentinense TaxID=2970906 RepID=A0A4D8PR43_9PROT|nr:transposase [Azospirillum argentinense]QCO00317.1 transposase [Azospirillum argentinense]